MNLKKFKIIKMNTFLKLKIGKIRLNFFWNKLNNYYLHYKVKKSIKIYSQILFAIASNFIQSFFKFLGRIIFTRKSFIYGFQPTICLVQVFAIVVLKFFGQLRAKVNKVFKRNKVSLEILLKCLHCCINFDLFNSFYF